MLRRLLFVLLAASGAAPVLAQDLPTAPLPPRLADAPVPQAARGGAGETIAPVGRWPYGYARSAALAGDVGVTAQGSVIQTLDLSDPDTLSVRGEAVLEGVVGDLAAEGALAAAVATHYEKDQNGLFVVDLSDPDAPAVRGSLTGFRANAVLVRGGVAYVATFERDGRSATDLLLVSLADPDAPVVVGEVPLPSFADDIAVLGDRVYLALGVAGLGVVDASAPEAPVYVGAASADFTAAVAVGTVGDASVLATIERAASGAAELRTYGGTDPNAPEALGAAALRSGVAFGVLPLDIVWDGTRAAMGTAYGGLQFADLSDPAAPAVEEQVATTVSFVVSATSRLAVSGSTLLATDVYSGVHRGDVQAGTLGGRMPTAGISLDVIADEKSGLVYVADGGAGLAVLAVPIPVKAGSEEFIEVGRVHGRRWNYASGLAQSATHVYVADGFAGIWAVDKATLEVTANVLRGTPIRTVASGGGLLLGVDDAQNVHVLTLEDPAAPSVASLLVPPRGATSAAVRGTTVYVGEANGNRLRVYDAADPSALQPVTDLALTGVEFELALSESRLYALGGGLAANVLDVTTPEAPALLGAVQSVVPLNALGAQGDVLVGVGDEVAAYGVADVPAAERLGGTVAFGDEQTAVAFVGPGQAVVAAGQAGVYLVATPLPTDGAPGAPSAGLRLAAGPNPSAGAPTVAVQTPAPEAIEIAVFDALGRRVRAWTAAASAGETRLAWGAAPLAPGVYVVRARTASGETATARVTVAR